MIQHLEALAALITKKRWLIGVLAKLGVFVPIESSCGTMDGTFDRIFSCESAKRSDYSISVDLFDNLLPAGSPGSDHDHSFVSLNVNFPLEDGTGDSAAWLQLRYHFDPDGDALAYLDRDGYQPDHDQEATFEMFPNGDKNEAEALAFIEAAARYYLTKPQRGQ